MPRATRSRTRARTRDGIRTDMDEFSPETIQREFGFNVPEYNFNQGQSFQNLEQDAERKRKALAKAIQQRDEADEAKRRAEAESETSDEFASIVMNAAGNLRRSIERHRAEAERDEEAERKEANKIKRDEMTKIMKIKGEEIKRREEELKQCMSEHDKLLKQNEELEKCMSEKDELQKQADYLNEDMSDMSIKLLKLERSLKDYERSSIQQDVEIEALKVIEDELTFEAKITLQKADDTSKKEDECRNEIRTLGLKIKQLNDIISSLGGEPEPEQEPEPEPESSSNETTAFECTNPYFLSQTDGKVRAKSCEYIMGTKPNDGANNNGIGLGSRHKNKTHCYERCYKN